MDTSEDYRANADPAGGYRSGRSPGEGEGLGSLISGTIKDLQELMRAEVQLAKTELKEDAAAAGRGIGVIAAGALVGLVGFIFLMLAVTYLLDRWFSQWVSAGIVGLVLAVIAAILVSSGRSKLSAANFKPQQTIDTLKEDKEWAKQQINSVKR
jgi:uncharacterized membrane protein YqjE